MVELHWAVCILAARQAGSPHLRPHLHPLRPLAGVWLTAANVLALGTVSLLPIVSGAVEEGLMRWVAVASMHAGFE